MIRASSFVISRICAALLPLCGISHGLEVPLASAWSNDPGPGHSAKAKGPFANQTLPPHVKAAGGSLTLFADHDHPDGESVPVYLINRGNKPVSFRTYSSNPGMVLEQFDIRSQTWRRAQAGMISSADCGLSYYPLSLAPGQHFRLDGYQPKVDATKGQIRFRLDACDVISNTGAGFWREADVANVPLDSHMIRRQPFGVDSQTWTLRYPRAGEGPEQMLVKLGMMKIWEDGPVFRAFAQALLREMEKPEAKEHPARAETIRGVHDLLAKRNPPGVRRDALFAACVEVLRGPRKDDFGSPSKFPGISWMALAWLRENGGMEWDSRWKEVYGLLVTRLDAPGEEEIPGMNQMILGNPLALEYLSGEILIKTAIAHAGLMEACLERLASTSDSTAILKVAEGADLPTRLMILPYMCVEPASENATSRYMKSTQPAEDYLLQCVKDAPWETASSLYIAMGFRAPGRLPNRVIQIYRNELSRLAEVAHTQPWPDPPGEGFQGMAQIVESLGNYSRADDPTLHQLRKLETITVQGETDLQKRHRQYIAKEARKFLLIAGWDPVQPPMRPLEE